jgi:hypothetical protein
VDNTPALNEYRIRPQGSAVGTSRATFGCTPDDSEELSAEDRDRLCAAVMKLPFLQSAGSISEEHGDMSDDDRF